MNPCIGYLTLYMGNRFFVKPELDPPAGRDSGQKHLAGFGQGRIAASVDADGASGFPIGVAS